MSMWTVAALAAVMAFFAWFTGHWSPTFWLALVVYLVVGFLFPPVGVVVGALVVLRLLLVHGQAVIAGIEKQLQPSGTAVA